MGLYGSPELPPTNEVPKDYWKTCPYCGHVYPRTYKVCPKCNNTNKNFLDIKQVANDSSKATEEKTSDTAVLFKQSGVLDLSALYASNRFVFSTF